MGAGTEDYGTIGVMPVRSISNSTVKDLNYRSLFSHKSEVATPWVYSVYLDTPQVHVNLTAVGNWTGVHLYTFDGGDPRYIVVDALHTVKKVGCVCVCVCVCVSIFGFSNT